MYASPTHISRLEPGEIFVFGSNADGHHSGGAARYAVKRFGAIWGQGAGIQGQSYAIDSMSGLPTLQRGVQALLAFAQSRPDLTFLVTEIGCGIAGHRPEDVAPFFADPPSNLFLPKSFIDVLAGAGTQTRQELPTNAWTLARAVDVEDLPESVRNVVLDEMLLDIANRPSDQRSLPDGAQARTDRVDSAEFCAELERAMDTLPEDSRGWLRSDGGDMGLLANIDDPRLLESIARTVMLDSPDLDLVGHELLLRALASQGKWEEAARILRSAEDRYWMWIDLGSPADTVQLTWLVTAHESINAGDMGLAYDRLVASAQKAIHQHLGWDREYLLMALCDLADLAPTVQAADGVVGAPWPILPRSAWARLALRLLARSPGWLPGRWFTDDVRDRLVSAVAM